MQLRNLFLNPTKGPERESVPTMKAASVSNWGQASVLPLFLHGGSPPLLPSMSEDYLKTSRMLNLAHTLTLQDTLTPVVTWCARAVKPPSRPGRETA